MFDHILVPMDGSLVAERVLPHAVAVARVYGSRVTLMRVLDQTRSAQQGQVKDLLDWHICRVEAEAYLDRFCAHLQEADLCAKCVLLEGPAAERIVGFVHDHDVDLVVLSSHGASGLSDWNIGSVAQKVILRACITVMIVRAFQPAATDLTGIRYQRLLVPLDGSQRAECVLPVGTALARCYGSQIVLAHVVCEPEMLPRRSSITREELQLVNQVTEYKQLRAIRYLEHLRAWFFSDAQTLVHVGHNAAATLHELVTRENVDLVVLSAHGYSGMTRWPYGSVALSFAVYGTTPLLILQDLPRDELEASLAETAAVEYKGH